MRGIDRTTLVSLAGMTAISAAAVWGALTSHGYAVAAVQAPSPTSPANNATLTNFAPQLSWSLPTGATQVHLQVTPANNDGPGVNVIVDAASSFNIPAPPAWYGLLPDMGYTWRVRATDATIAVTESDASWGPWSSDTIFRTPKIDIASVAAAEPANGVLVTSVNPVLKWTSTTANVYYWEIQVSKDRQFGPGSFLYWSLIHGDVVYPNNAYLVPSSFPLEPGSTYYWRVRPRIQGDGTVLTWPGAASFTTPAAGALTLNVTAPADESTVATATVTVTGKTMPGAYVSVEDELIIADSAGNFSVNLTLAEGPNPIEVFVTDGNSGETVTTTLTVSYLP